MARGPLARYKRLVARKAIKGDPHQLKAVIALERLHKQLRGYHPRRSRFFGLFPAPTPPKGLYIHGPVGRGKSMVMDLFFDALMLKEKRRVHFHAFMAEVHAAVHEWRGLTERERRHRPNHVHGAGDDPIAPIAESIAREALVLCFDEFQVTDIADAMILGRLFEALFARGVVVVATSNRAPAELYENGINRQLFLPFIDLIAARMSIISLDGPIDYRLAKLKGNQVYFTPLNADSAAKLDSAWHHLTGMAKGARGSLMSGGRRVAIPEEAKGVARFTFQELCGGDTFGPGDYVALSAAYHALVVSGVPYLSDDLRDAARRFTTFIDGAYEAHVKFVCSAADQPDKLFRARDGAKEFERTASRLFEMQSSSYLEKPHRSQGH